MATVIDVVLTIGLFVVALIVFRWLSALLLGRAAIRVRLRITDDAVSVIDELAPASDWVPCTAAFQLIRGEWRIVGLGDKRLLASQSEQVVVFNVVSQHAELPATAIGILDGILLIALGAQPRGTLAGQERLVRPGRYAAKSRIEFRIQATMHG